VSLCSYVLHCSSPFLVFLLESVFAVSAVDEQEEWGASVSAHKATVCVRFQGEKRGRGRTEVGLRNLSVTPDRRRRWPSFKERRRNHFLTGFEGTLRRPARERERQISTKGQIESVYERERKIGPIWHKRFSLYWVNIGCACSCWQKKLCCSVITMVWCDAGRLNNNNNNNNNVNSLTQFPLNLKLFLLWFLSVSFVFRWFDCHFCSNYFCFYKWKEEKISKFSYCCFPSPNL